MNNAYTFHIAQHEVVLHNLTTLNLEQALLPYQPFLAENTQLPILFRATLKDKVEVEITKTILDNQELTSSSFVKVNVYETMQGHYFEIFMPKSKKPNGSLHIDQTNKCITFSLAGSEYDETTTFNNCFILGFLYFGIAQGSMLMHASCVVKEEKGYLFLGKSGTGKSTHSRMWLENFPDAFLLNDDHPIIRVMQTGEIRVFGSPWSGKTPCYKNQSAPLAAIVRIRQAQENIINKLPTPGAFASITTSASGMQWSASHMDHKALVIEQLICNVGCYILNCLPNLQAAQYCYKEIN